MKVTQEIIDHIENRGLFNFKDLEGRFFNRGKILEIIFTKGSASFRSSVNRCLYYVVEIYKPNKKVKSPIDLMTSLILNEFEPDDYGYFRRKYMNSFCPQMWKSCGKSPDLRFDYNPEWLEHEK